MKKLLIIFLGLVLLVGCNSNDTFNVQGTNLETQDVVGKEMLTKDINVVYIWQPTCPPCEIESKIIENIYRDFKNVNFVGIGVAPDQESINEAINNWNTTFTNYKMTDEFYKDVTQYVDKTPALLYLNSEGEEIADREVGYILSTQEIEPASEELREKIQKLVDNI